VLDTLTKLEELGIALRSDGRRVWTDRPLPPELAAALRQCNNRLARLVGKGEV
jgi:hypothetical protein